MKWQKFKYVEATKTTTGFSLGIGKEKPVCHRKNNERERWEDKIPSGVWGPNINRIF